MSLATIIKDIQDRLKGMENIKEIIFDEVEETITDFKKAFVSIGDMIRAEIREELTELKLKLFGEFDEVRQELLSHIDDLKTIKEDLMIDFEELSEEVKEDVKDVIVDQVNDTKSVIEDILKTNPELFSNRIKLTKHMNSFIAEKGYGKDWYPIYKSLKRQLQK